MFRYSGGDDPAMTPYMCLENCMRQQLHQRYDKELFFGLTQGTRCLCGYDYELRKSIGGNIISRGPLVISNVSLQLLRT